MSTHPASPRRNRRRTWPAAALAVVTLGTGIGVAEANGVDLPKAASGHGIVHKARQVLDRITHHDATAPAPSHLPS
ncbi:hypothetical protein ACQB60_44955 [Actinomycetota bacterium Odt1-20B]